MQNLTYKLDEHLLHVYMLHGEKRTSQIVGVDLGRDLMVPGHFFGASQLLTLH